MADPISIFGATASVLSIIDILAKTISTAHSLRGQWKDADIALISLTSQLGALRAALEKIKEWMESGFEDLHHQLVLDLGTSMDCCQMLAAKIHSELTDLQKTPNGTLATMSKARFLFKSSDMKELQNMIDRQTSVLTLLLTACNSKTLAEQQKLLRRSSTRSTIVRVQKDTASLIGHADSRSMRTASTEKSSKLSMMFDFDNQLFGSRPYTGMIWKSVKLSIQSRRRTAFQPLSDAEPEMSEKSDMTSLGISRGAETTTSDTAQQQRGPKNVLLLGAGNTSKSTFVKQMQSIYGEDISSVNDRDSWRSIMRENLRCSIQVLVDVLLENTEFLEGQDPALTGAKWRAFESIESGKELPDLQYFLAFKKHLDDDLGLEKSRKFIGSVIEKRMLEGNAHGLPQNIDYFLTHLDRICAENFIPTEADIIQARTRTTGIHRYSFCIGLDNVQVHDVGGERSEKKKWIKVFDGFPAVIFFVPMSGYDQSLYEDENGNQMHESLMLFESIVNSKYFERSEFHLCFTKMDIFEKKMASGSWINPAVFPRYGGPPGHAPAAQAFFIQEFKNLVRRPESRPVQIHFLDATNTEETRGVLKDIFKGEVSNSKNAPSHERYDSASNIKGEHKPIWLWT